MSKIFWLIAVPIYFASRLANLTLIPIFTDEAIYLRWSQIISGDLKYLYLPLTDGKPPLFMWLVALLMKFLPGFDPLLVGRLVSVGAGFLGMLGVYFLARQLFASKITAYLAVIFYLICPFTFFYDRFALADTLLSAFGVWSLGLGVFLVRTQRWLVALILGLVLGLGWLTKTPALFFLVLLPLLVLLKPKNLVKFAIQLSLAWIIARGIYSLLFFLPQAYVISLKSYEFVVPLAEFLKQPFQFFAGNLRTLSWWEIQYLTWPVVVIILISLAKISRPKIILLAYFLSLFLFMGFFNKVIYPRFLLMFTPMLLVLAAAALAEFKKPYSWLALVVVLVLPIYTNLKVLTDPVKAPIADTDSTQYLNSWSAGWGIKELNTFFTQETKKYPKITVGTEGTFGLMPYGLELYQDEHPNLEIKPYWPVPEDLPPGLDYFIIYQRDSAPASWPVELVAKYQAGSSQDAMRLYKIKL